MGRKNQGFSYRETFVLGVLFLVSCATIPQLNIHYELPFPSPGLEGKRLYLKVMDARVDKEVLGRGAEKDFEGFSGDLILGLSRVGGLETKVGLFKADELLLEGFKRRLTELGIVILAEPVKGEPEMVLVLHKFKLDLVDQKWVGSMDYEARLVKEGTVRFKQSFSGGAERAKVVGHGAAETMMGELFTDMVNRLDVARFFQAGRGEE